MLPFHMHACVRRSLLSLPARPTTLLLFAPHPTLPPPAPLRQGLTWVMDMLKLTLKPGLRGRAMPRVLFFDELEALNATAWLGFQRVLMVRTR